MTASRSLGGLVLGLTLAASVTASSGAVTRGAQAGRCPNPEGGACVGPLTPGRTYTTKLLTPTLSYSVPSRGWRNFEDYRGGFLLVPPGNDLAGVNAERSDFIGVATSIAAARFSDLPRCSTERVPGVANTPSAIARWIRKQPQLRVRGPSAAEVGGLRGVKLDIQVKAEVPIPTCTDAGQSFTVFLLFTGLPPSFLDHGVVTGSTIRLYLLRYRGGTLEIEANDKRGAAGTIRSLDAVVRRFDFTP